jgi:hypothetical protein
MGSHAALHNSCYYCFNTQRDGSYQVMTEFKYKFIRRCATLLAYGRTLFLCCGPQIKTQCRRSISYIASTMQYELCVLKSHDTIIDLS